MDLNEAAPHRMQVISMDAFRRTSKARRRKVRTARPLVALWFGSAAIAAAVAVWAIMGVAMRFGAVGIAALVVIAAAIAWPAAGGYLGKLSASRHARSAARTAHPTASKAPVPRA